MADRWGALGQALGTIVLEIGRENQKKQEQEQNKQKQEQNDAFYSEISNLIGSQRDGGGILGSDEIKVKPSGQPEGEDELLLETPEIDINEVFGPSPEGIPDLSQLVSEDEASQFMDAYGMPGDAPTDTPTTEPYAMDENQQKAQKYVEMLGLASKYNVSDTKVLDNIMRYMYPKEQKKTGTDWEAKYEYDKLMKGPGGLQWNLEKMKSENINQRQQTAHLRKMSGMERKYHLMGEQQKDKADDAMDALNIRRNMKIYGQMDSSIQETMAGLQSGDISKEEAEKNIQTVHDYYEKQQEKLWEEISSEESYLLPKAVRELKLGQLEDILESKDKAADAMRALKVKSPQIDTERRKLENMKAKFAKDARTKKGAERKKALFYLQKVNEQLQQLK